MTLPGILLIRVKLAVFSMLAKLTKSSVWPIYRGGFILDLFYAQKQMRYQVLTLTKASSEQKNRQETHLKATNAQGNSL